MEYSLRAMELWFQQLPGSLLLEIENKALTNWFSNHTNAGIYCLQMGGPSDLSLIRAAPFLHKVYLSTYVSSMSHSSCIQSSLDTLPIMPDSVDAFVLVHLLEFAATPEQLLEEIYGILTPEGQLILLVLNPWSLWGMARFKLNRQGFPWSGQFYSVVKIKRWLQSVGYSIILSKSVCFRPVLYDAHQCERWSCLESIGSYCFAGLGASSLIIAQKHKVGMTPIRVLKHRQVKVGRRIIESTTYR